MKIPLKFCTFAYPLTIKYIPLDTKSISVTKKEAIQALLDYKLACESREASLMGRKEVFMGKAKFGIFGDGKELAQIAMARAFKKGDWRSGYYRDQTFMLAIGETSVKEYFAQLYALTDVEAEPASAGRMMNGHFGTRFLDEDGNLKDVVNSYNSVSDISPTGGQIPRLVGLGYASKLFRQNPDLHKLSSLSNKGNEVAFGTIGNAATSEGMFYEAINAAGVLQIPVIFSVWDDGYGISVSNEFHTTKQSISEALKGFERDGKLDGFEILTVKGYDYPELIKTYQYAADLARNEHLPVLIHVQDMTQPQGHSTSGSHERYKSKERLDWEKNYDCIVKLKEWILEQEIASESELTKIEKAAAAFVKKSKEEAWKNYISEIDKDVKEVSRLLENVVEQTKSREFISRIKNELDKTVNPLKMDVVRSVKKVLRVLRSEHFGAKDQLQNWLKRAMHKFDDQYSSHMFSQSASAALKVPTIDPIYSDSSPMIDGREVLLNCFDKALNRDPRIFAFGEDVGKIGDVNQAFAGLQDKYGDLRVTDTGIREVTIIGQGIGAAIRGLRPIAEIQYLDYLVYALAPLTDDLACLQYRTKGGQKAPLIVRTRGHRLEGIWHSGSPMSMMLGSLRGIYICTPRNMTQAAGMYNTLLQSDDAAIVIESLNGYRLKERLPDNVDTFTVPLGVPEILREGDDITVVTYGSMCKVVMAAARQLHEVGISIEVIDVQTLMPFDLPHLILESIKKTNRVIFADEDVPGGASAFMMQMVVEHQNAYEYLDSKPLTITSKEHRPAYGSDGDYFSKPSVEDVFDTAYSMMNEYNPSKFPSIYE